MNDLSNEGSELVESNTLDLPALDPDGLTRFNAEVSAPIDASDQATSTAHPRPPAIAWLALRLHLHHDDPNTPTSIGEHVQDCSDCQCLDRSYREFLNRHPEIRTCPQSKERVLSQVVAGIADEESTLFVQFHCLICTACRRMAQGMLVIKAGAPVHCEETE